MKKILLFGASGFIGSEINKILTSPKFKLISVVNINNKKFPKKFFKNLIKINITNPIKEKIKNIDTVVHAATPNDIVSKNFKKGINLSLIGTKNILDFCLKNNVKNLIFFSTFQVYGTNLTGNITEKSKINLNNFYSLNHYFGEELCRLFSKLYKLNIIILRPSNVYGVPLLKTINRDTLVPLCFAKDLKEKKKIKLFSSGRQNRNFISNTAISMVCKKLISNFPKGFNILNLSSNLNLSILTIAKQIIRFSKLKKKNAAYNLDIQSKYPLKENKFKVIKSNKIKHVLRTKVLEKKIFDKVLVNILKF